MNMAAEIASVLYVITIGKSPSASTSFAPIFLVTLFLASLTKAKLRMVCRLRCSIEIKGLGIMKATFKLLSQEGKAVNFLQPQKQKVDVRFDPTFFQACSWLDSRRLQLCGALEALCKHCHISFMGSTLCSSPTLLLSAAAAAASL